MTTQKKPYPRRAVATLGALLLTLCSTVASVATGADTSLSRKPDSFEFKVLLNNNQFDDDRDAAMDSFLERLQATIEKQGAGSRAKWKIPARRKQKQREVRYLDVAEITLYRSKQKLIFRTRNQMKKTCQPPPIAACKPSKAKLTLKQRFADGVDRSLFDLTPDVDKALAVPGLSVSADDKFEQDYSWAPGDDGKKTILRKRSLSSSVEIEDLSERGQVRDYENFADLKALYPNIPWSEIDIEPDEPLLPTCAIASTVIKIGTVEVDDDNACPASFTFWRKQSDQTPLASEFSFTCRNSSFFSAARGKAEAIFKEMIEDPFVKSRPSTKTAIAYACSPDVDTTQR